MTTTSTGPIFTLHAQDHEAASAMLPISWCAHEGLAEELLSTGIADPRVLLVVQRPAVDRFGGYEEKYWRDVSYQLAPFKQGLAHVTFRRPGLHRVTAIVVDVGDELSRKQLRLLVRTGPVGADSPHNSIVMFHGQGRPYFNYDALTDVSLTRIKLVKRTTTVVEVDVDERMFAAPLAPWRLWVAKRVFGNTKFRDECSARRKTLIFGPLLLPFVLLAANLSKLVVLPALAALGLRDVNYRELLRPLGSFFDLLPERFSSVWWQRKNRKYRRGAPVNIVLSPPVLALLPLIPYGFFQIPIHDKGEHGTHLSNAMPLWQAYLWVDGSLVAAVAGAAAVVFAIIGVAALTSEVQSRVTGHQRRSVPQDEQAIRRAVEYATCGDAVRAGLGDVSIRAWTPRLVYNAAKAAVCKPFAQ